MSARWRRSKKSLQRFNIFKNLRKPKKKKSKTENLWIKRQTRTNKGRSTKICLCGKAKELDPLIDILAQEMEITVVVELAGFAKEDLQINVKNQRLTLSAKALDRKFYKSLNLPAKVIPETMRTTYKNGVLEVKLKKAVEEKTINKMAG
ncbi:MAG: Hsp20/alpha crystallin family protein [Candidatus Bathyarchaeia archaeon]